MNRLLNDFIKQLNFKTLEYSKRQFGKDPIALEFVKKLNQDNLKWAKKQVRRIK